MSYIQVGHFEASGAAVTLTFNQDRNPDFLMLVNATQFATTAKNVVGYWFRDYEPGDMSNILNDTTAGMMGVAEATNGITVVDSVAYADTANVTQATHTLTLSIGSAFYGSDSDEIFYVAVFADKFLDHGDINA